MGVEQSKKSHKVNKFAFDLIGNGTFTLALNEDGLLEEIDSSTEMGDFSEVKYSPEQDKKKLVDGQLSNELEKLEDISIKEDDDTRTQDPSRGGDLES